MSSSVHPLTLSAELEHEIRRMARLRRLSMADVMRQSIRLGLPQLRETFNQKEPAPLRPFTREEARQSWEVPNAEFDAIEHHCASLHKSRIATINRSKGRKL